MEKVILLLNYASQTVLQLVTDEHETSKHTNLMS